MITIRPATTSDQEHLGRFGGALMRQHHAADPRRFIQVEHPEAGYGPSWSPRSRTRTAW